MGGGHDHHHPPYKVPDYSVFKVADAPRLVALEAKLAKIGLKDPWIRNEVWRFDTRQFPTHGQNLRMLFGKGFLIGAGLCALTILFDKMTSKDHGHGHDHH